MGTWALHTLGLSAFFSLDSSLGTWDAQIGQLYGEFGLGSLQKLQGLLTKQRALAAATACVAQDKLFNLPLQLSILI